MTAAERLFARQGIEGTSLREISAAAGLSNNSSVQYHFGSKETLLENLFFHRMMQMENRREQMLESARKNGLAGDMRTLMEIICLPHLDVVDGDGRHSYAEFLSQYLLRYRPPAGLLADPPEPPAPLQLAAVQRLIREQLSDLPEEVVMRRLVISVLGFLAVLINHKSFIVRGGKGRRLDIALADTMDQITIAMSLPFRDVAIAMPATTAQP
ncbi:MAG: TetR/AcrR family transcriptional regulator [Sphingobium sp.]